MALICVQQRERVEDISFAANRWGAGLLLLLQLQRSQLLLLLLLLLLLQ